MPDFVTVFRKDAKLALSCHAQLGKQQSLYLVVTAVPDTPCDTGTTSIDCTETRTKDTTTDTKLCMLNTRVISLQDFFDVWSSAIFIAKTISTWRETRFEYHVNLQNRNVQQALAPRVSDLCLCPDTQDR